MRIIVASDSHGDVMKLRLAVEQQPTAEIMFFLGDGLNDFLYANINIPVIKVKGNCDFNQVVNDSFIDEFNGKKIFATHGYRENVKYSLDALQKKAVEIGAHIALYGHTHNPVTKYIDGIWYINPGSIKQGSYAVIDIKPSGILPTLMTVRY